MMRWAHEQRLIVACWRYSILEFAVGGICLHAAALFSLFFIKPNLNPTELVVPEPEPADHQNTGFISLSKLEITSEKYQFLMFLYLAKGMLSIVMGLLLYCGVKQLTEGEGRWWWSRLLWVHVHCAFVQIPFTVLSAVYLTYSWLLEQNCQKFGVFLVLLDFVTIAGSLVYIWVLNAFRRVMETSWFQKSKL